MKFERSRSFNDMPSMYRLRFQKDQTEYNQFYWTLRLGSDISSKLDREFPSDDLEALISRHQVGSVAAEKLDRSKATFREQTRTARRWLVHSTLLAALSAFERYLVNIASLAVASDPTLTRGWPKQVDGLSLKKHSLAIAQPSLVGLVKQEWSSRAARYRELFAEEPTELANSLGELEKMRKLRNKIAHEFSYEPSADADRSADLLVAGLRRPRAQSQASSLSQNRLTKWLAILDRAVRSVDKQLMLDYIGSYEMVASYLDWLANPDQFEARLGVELSAADKKSSKRFRLTTGQYIGPMSDEYFQTMIEFLDER